MRTERSRSWKQITDAPPYTEQVSVFIKEVILSGHYEPGQRLSEVELSEAIGTSRSPIREAFQRLAKEGLVNLVPRKGAYVKALDKRELKELFEVREGLELVSVALAAERATDSDLDELLQFLSRTRSAIENRDYRQYPWNLDFHKQIAKCAKNKYLEEKIDEVNAQLLLVRQKSGSEAGRASEAFNEHKMICDALANRQTRAAQRLMRQHIHISRENIMKLFGERE
jgi:DNA-binding GntR family transcriptional regulator